MRIQGLQKLTLLDYPGRTACTVFLSGCNFRCPFCHNAPLLQGDTGDAMDEDALLMFLKKRQGVLDGVAVTGGEPLLRQELPSLLEKIKALGYAVKLDTNGAFPERLEAIVQAGLADYVAMDVKNSPARYAQTAGVPGLDLGPIRESVAFLLAGHVDYEFRTTVVKQFHDRAAFQEIGPWLAGARRYFLQSYEDRDTVLCPGLSPCSREELEDFASAVRPFVPAVALRGV